jgi:hypothetical protein
VTRGPLGGVSRTDDVGDACFACRFDDDSGLRGRWRYLPWLKGPFTQLAVKQFIFFLERSNFLFEGFDSFFEASNLSIFS